MFDAGGHKAHVETQWSVIHRLPRWGKLTDMWHQGRYLDEFEKRDGSRKILRRVTVLDAERWIDTADLQRLVPASSPNQVHRGRRGSDDPVSGNAGGTPALAQCVRRTTRRQRGDPRSPHRPGTTTHH